MPRSKFEEILQCLEWEPDSLFEFANKKMKEVWNPHRDISLDEMMIPYKGKNPHHVVVKRKSHPNGTKVWAIVDKSKFIYHLSMYKRTTEEYSTPALFGGKQLYIRNSNIGKETTKDTAMRMISKLPDKGFVIYADSYFGGLDLADCIEQNGNGCVLACRKDRPSWLFNYTESCSDDSFTYTSAIGMFPSSNKPFSSYKIINTRKKMCLISTVHNPLLLVNVNEERLVGEGEETDIITVNCYVPKARYDYLTLSSQLTKRDRS